MSALGTIPGDYAVYHFIETDRFGYTRRHFHGKIGNSVATLKLLNTEGESLLLFINSTNRELILKYNGMYVCGSHNIGMEWVDSESSRLMLAEQCFMMLLQMPHCSLMMDPLMKWALSWSWAGFPSVILALSSAWTLTPVGYISKSSVPSGFWVGLANMSSGRQGRKKWGLFLLLHVCLKSLSW